MILSFARCRASTAQEPRICWLKTAHTLFQYVNVCVCVSVFCPCRVPDGACVKSVEHSLILSVQVGFV